MKHIWLLSVVIFLVRLPESLQECLLQSIKGVPSYVCGSIQELEIQGSQGSFDVVIHQFKNPPSINRKPNLKIVLIEDGKDGITADTLKLLKDVQKTLVQSNKQITIPAGLFAHLPIQEINLQNNGIVEIDNGAFNNVESLKKLYIIENKVSEVKSGVFSNLPLETLSLSNNRISFIQKNAFMNMTRLKFLYLDGNRLTEFQPEVLMNNAHKLEVLHLQNNSFSELDRNTVRGLYNVKILNLRNNRIQQISSYTFDHLVNLEVLLLSNNLLKTLDAESFPQKGLEKLQKLQINNNQLSFLRTNVLERFASLKSISITGNPWQCPCLDAILAWLGDHDVQQNCDRAYYDGTRPICIVDDSHPNTCYYETNSNYYHKYNEINSKAPSSPLCDT